MLKEWSDRVTRSGRPGEGRLLAIATTVILGLLLFGLSGCSSEADRAEKRYNFLKEQRASYREVCDAGREWVRELSKAQSHLYGETRLIVEVDCDTGELRGFDQPYKAEE